MKYKTKNNTEYHWKKKAITSIIGRFVSAFLCAATVNEDFFIIKIANRYIYSAPILIIYLALS